MAQNSSWRTIDSVQTAIRIVMALKEDDGARISDLADQLGLSPSTVHAHLKTLEADRFVVQKDDGYYLGLQLLNLGGHVATEREEFQLASKKVAELAAETGERAQFVVEEFGRGYYLTTETGERAALMNARIGKQPYLHVSSAGKAILAALPETRVEEIIDRWGLPQMTENTITERERLYEELDMVRQQGYAVNREESIPGLRAIGVSVESYDGDVIGSLSVSGPSNRMHEERVESELVNLLRGMANEMELTLHHS